MEKITIVAGKYGGRKISTPGGKTHPMGSRERLALFNMLGKIEGAYILDAFSGSGALGIEALSRDAFKVVFIDKEMNAIKTIKENLKTLGIKEGFQVIKGVLPVAAQNLGTFDAILADPPYDNFENIDITSLGESLVKGGVLVLSHPGGHRFCQVLLW